MEITAQNFHSLPKHKSTWSLKSVCPFATMPPSPCGEQIGVEQDDYSGLHERPLSSIPVFSGSSSLTAQLSEAVTVLPYQVENNKCFLADLADCEG